MASGRRTIDDDVLLALREHFYLGAYARVREEYDALMGLDDPELEAHRDDFLNRAHIANGQFSEVVNASEHVELLASYKSADDDNKKLVVDQIRANPEPSSDSARIVYAEILMSELDYKGALGLVHDGTVLEMKALAVQIYLKIDRLDLAQKIVEQMVQIDDNAVLTTFATAWVGLYKPTEGVNTITDALTELLEMYVPTVPLLNLLGVCQMHQGAYAEAFQFLKQARALAVRDGRNVNADTLVNTTVCLAMLGKGTHVTDKIVGELERQHGQEEPWIVEQAKLKGEFAKIVSEYE